MSLAQTQAIQHRASDPAVSAWVSANAGSGKTHVLAQRVVRLLLAGTPPGRILCLTFTKAAAANMAARVFQTLAKWALMADGALVAAIEATGAAKPRPEELVFARRLFARTIETPGGLKIQTIHAFCERLLHLFPFEANVASGFEVIEARRQAELLAQARTSVLEAAIREEDGLGPALRALAGETSAATFEDVLEEALRCRADLAERALEPPGQALAHELGLAPGETCETLGEAMLNDGIAPSRWAGLATWFSSGTANDQKQAQRLSEAVALFQAGQPDAALDKYLSVFLTQKDGPRASLATKTIALKNPRVLPLLQAESVRLLDCLDKRRAAAMVERTAALVTLASAIFARYEQLKAERSLIDFEDLIARTKRLLERSDAAWVLYKLDSGIDHILVDEAQDTSPAQWDILKRLAEDFTTGKGQRQQRRTLFAVGDEKQSIYSFQGAAPHMFAAMRRHFASRVTAAGQPFEGLDLTMSFRSAPEILQAVDHVFGTPGNYAGLSADGDQTRTVHTALKTTLRGHVEIWQPIQASALDAPAGWSMPLDSPDSSAPASRLARRIAGTIGAMVSPGSPQRVWDHAANAPRPVQAGDIMILVRARNSFFDAMIRALKDQDVSVAGADRLALTSHIAVMDLMAAGRTALLPQDDLTLACALKSPLIGLDDEDLIEIAPGRAGSLVEALQAARPERFQMAARHLAVWRARAQDLTPFGFYARLLGADGGRLALVERLGQEAGDAIDEFLSLALAHEREAAPSLATFLGGLERAGLQIKRDMEAPGEAVRVMTVHAAKGLEAKIVFLPDTCSRPGPPRDPAIFRLEPNRAGGLGGNSQAGILAWSPRKGDDPAPVAEARQESHRLAVEENRRLLYVAMTRAEERLYISGSCGTRGPADGCWYQMASAALMPHYAQAPAAWDAQEAIWRSGEALAEPSVADPRKPAAASALPEWLRAMAPDEPAALAPLRPSQALEAADRVEAASPEASLARHAARERGKHLHVLMQYLPALHPVQRRLAGENYLAAQPGLSQAAALLDKVLAVISDPRLVALFAEGSLAEIAMAGHIMRTDGKRLEVSGQIDRLAVSDSEVLIADFKTGRPRPLAETPFSIVTQLAIYRALAGEIYPGRSLRALVVWTQGPSVVELDAARLDAALALLRLA